MIKDEQLFAEGQRALTDALLSAAVTRSKLESLGRTRDVRLLNVAQFAILFNFDLRQLLHDIARQRGTWGAKLYARTLALTMYECAEDFIALLGKDFRSLAAELGGPDALEALGSLHSRMRSFFDTNRDYLKAIRTEIVGHREHNATLQMERLRSTKVADLEALGLELLRWLNDFHPYIGSLMTAAKAKSERQAG